MDVPSGETTQSPPCLTRSTEKHAEPPFYVMESISAWFARSVDRSTFIHAFFSAFLKFRVFLWPHPQVSSTHATTTITLRDSAHRPEGCTEQAIEGAADWHYRHCRLRPGHVQEADRDRHCSDPSAHRPSPGCCDQGHPPTCCCSRGCCSSLHPQEACGCCPCCCSSSSRSSCCCCTC